MFKRSFVGWYFKDWDTTSEPVKKQHMRKKKDTAGERPSESTKKASYPLLSPGDY